MMIETIREILYVAGTVTARSFWLPLAAWTILALPIYLGLRRRETIHPVVRYYLQRGLLLSLPLGLLAANVFDISGWVGSSSPAEVGAGAVVVLLPEVVENLSEAAAVRWNMYHGLGVLCLVAGLAAVWQVLKLGVQAVRLARFSHRIDGMMDLRLEQKVRRLAAEMQIARRLRAVTTSRDISPMTFGYRRPTVVIPDHIAADEERLEMTLVHELTHIRRGDYLWHWLERTMEAFLAVHPLVSRLRREIDALREMVCDAEVIERLSCSRRRYALLLCATVVPEAARDSFAIAMSENGANLKRRIEAMRDYTDDVERFLRPKYLGLALGGLLTAGAIFLVSCSDIVGPHQAVPDVQSSEERPSERMTDAASADKRIFVAVEDMPELKGGLASIQQKIRYPEQARQAGVEGTVIVQFVVDKQGNVVEPTVLRGIGAGCDEEAIRAVKQAEFEPGRQRGKPVRVKMSLPVRYALVENSGSSGDTAGSETSSVIDLEVGERGTLRLDDRPVALENLAGRIRALNITRSTTLRVRVDGGASMEFVNDVQQQLRASDVLRIHYRQKG